MTLIDTINNLTGATRKAKGAQMSQLGQDIELVEDFLANEIPEGWYQQNVPEDFVEDMNRGNSIVLRLASKLELSYTDEIANDMILVGKSALLLDTAVLLDYGWHLNSSEEDEVRFNYPEFYRILQMGNAEIVSHLEEARNTITHLYEKYPY